ncbi:MAG: methyltransferase [Lachnospiraceae bacterium]|nr:methyltransferase [Lachnospiraceae bacterium]
MKMNENIILKFKQYLDDFNYHLLVTLVLGEAKYYINPLPDYYETKKELKKLDEKKQKIISFFLLGEPIEKEIIEEEMDKEVLDYLYEISAVNRDDIHYWFNSLMITSYCNCYFLVGIPYYYPTCQNDNSKPYIGTDSYWLSRLVVNQMSGDVLDLCTGSGIQAILAAKSGARVIAVDIDDESIKWAQFNICLNELNEKVELRLGNLYSAIDQPMKFDYILSNPPFIPIPDTVDFPIAGDGGQDGRNIVRKIFNGYEKHLKTNGKAIMIGQGIGDKYSVFLSQDLKTILKTMNVKVYYSSCFPIELQAVNFAKMANKIEGDNKNDSKLWTEIYKELGAEYLYNFTVIVKKDVAKYDENWLYDCWLKEDIPIISYSKITQLSSNYSVTTRKNTSFIIDDEVKEFLEKVDGRKDVAEVVESMPFKYKVKYLEDSQLKMLTKYMNLCSVLEREGLMIKNGVK